MEKVFFTKLSGAGNDFIFINKNTNPTFKVAPDIIKKLCNRRNGVGADGLIFVEDESGLDYKMSYYNADGSTGSLCANGARCSILFAKNIGRLKSNNVKFSVNGNEYSGEVIENELIKLNLNSPKKIKYNFKIKAFGQLVNASFADTGSPHVVIKISDVLKNSLYPNSFFKDIAELPVYDFGKEIRYNNSFAPEGTNVNFINVVDKQIYIRTYERGVEDETLACGTGSVAAALICFVNDNLKPPITLITQGGDSLLVNFNVENQKVKNLSLTGPAKIVFEGSINKNLLI